MRKTLLVIIISLVCLLSGACDDHWGPASGDNRCDLKTLSNENSEPDILRTFQQKGWVFGCLRVESAAQEAGLPAFAKAVKLSIDGRIWAYELPANEQGPLTIKLPDQLRSRSLLFRVIVPGSAGQGRDDIEAFCSQQYAKSSFVCQSTNLQECWFEMYFRASQPDGRKSAAIPKQPESVACWLHAPWTQTTPGEVIISEGFQPESGVVEPSVSDAGVVEPVGPDRGDECRPGARESCQLLGVRPPPDPDPNCQGTRICDANGVWGACEGVTQSEICGDKIDNNCDGQIDEGCPTPGCLQPNEGCVSTIAGKAGQEAPSDQKGRTTVDKALFSYPQGVLVHGAYIYVTEPAHGQPPSDTLLRVISKGYVYPVAPLSAPGVPEGLFDLGSPRMMTRGANDDFWLVDSTKSQAYYFHLPVPGTTKELLFNKVDLSSAGSPYAIAFDRASKRLFFSSYSGNKIWYFSSTGLGQVALHDFAGSGKQGNANGIGEKASFYQPTGLAIYGDFLYVADGGNHCIRKISLSNAEVSTLAGTCGTEGATNGLGAVARFRQPAALDIDTNEAMLLVADGGNHCIRKIVLGGIGTGLVSTLAGSCGKAGRSYVDGQLLDARFAQPNGISFDGIGSLYVADSGNQVIRKITLPK